MKNKKIYKNWWFWVIIFILFVGAIGSASEENNISKDNNLKHETYELVGQTIGDFGRKVVLNANTDSPTTKYLYKIPSGIYEVTTDNEKLSSFFIVKDKIEETGTEEYPEELNYVGTQYSLTAGDDNFNGMAKEKVEIKLSKDESILITGTEKIIFEKLS